MVFLVLLSAAIIQGTFGPLLGVLGVIPDIVLILVVCQALVRGSEEGMLWGLLGGLSLDLLSGGPVGAHTLGLVLTGYIVGLVKLSPLQSRFLVPLMAMVAATVGYDAVLALVLRATGWPLTLWPDTAQVMAPSIVTNGVLMPFVYFALSRIAELRGGLRPEF